jgi:hypothetical protein
MCQSLLAHLARKVRHVPGPIAERRPEAVSRRLHVGRARNRFAERHVADGCPCRKLNLARSLSEKSLVKLGRV